ncbi:MAG: helix-turn-helix domain-containing protein [Rhodospirillaceae bacterium]
MNESTIVRYRPGRDRKPLDRTDWDRIRAASDAEIEAAASTDPDNPPLDQGGLECAALGRQVRLLRGRLGLSQPAFAERFRIPVASVRDWEQGRRTPDAATKAYLMVIDREPEAVLRALSAA